MINCEKHRNDVKYYVHVGNETFMTMNWLENKVNVYCFLMNDKQNSLFINMLNKETSCDLNAFAEKISFLVLNKYGTTLRNVFCKLEYYRPMKALLIIGIDSQAKEYYLAEIFNIAINHE